MNLFLPVSHDWECNITTARRALVGSEVALDKEEEQRYLRAGRELWWDCDYCGSTCKNTFGKITCLEMCSSQGCRRRTKEHGGRTLTSTEGAIVWVQDLDYAVDCEPCSINMASIIDGMMAGQSEDNKLCLAAIECYDCTLDFMIRYDS